MKKGQVLAHESGTAARVIAHAAWQRSRGRKPSMPFLAQNNPRKALQAAKIIATSNPMNALVSRLGEILVQRIKVEVKDWRTLTETTLTAAVRHIVVTSSSEEEVRRCLREDIGYDQHVSLHSHLPDDTTGREARELVRAMGGLAMTNGAMVM